MLIVKDNLQLSYNVQYQFLQDWEDIWKGEQMMIDGAMFFPSFDGHYFARLESTSHRQCN